MKKHILIICQFFYPEPFRINDIAFEWVKRGYRVSVVTGIPNYPEGKFYPGYGFFKHKKETVNGVEIYRIPLIPRGKGKLGLVLNYFSFPISGFWWSLFSKQRPDLVFMLETSPMNQCKVGVRFAKMHNIPCFLYVQDLWPENVEMITGIHSPLIIKPITRMVEKIYAGCTHLWGTSPSFVTEMAKRLPPEQRDKVTFWPQYAEDFYQPKPRKLHDGFNIMFTGNIGQAQGLEILPKAARILKDRDIVDVRFTIVGEGRARSAFERAIAEEGVEDLFTFTGRRPATEIPFMLAESDAAFLSFADDDLFAKTIPAKLQSYMACAMPILASARGETVRVITEADCGLCSDLGDAAGLADNIITMRNYDKERLNKMCDNALVYNNKHFNKKILMDEMDRWLNGELK
mgnify:FL=1